MVYSLKSHISKGLRLFIPPKPTAIPQLRLPVTPAITAAFFLAASITTAVPPAMAWSCHGDSNHELVHNLKRAGIIRSHAVERGMEAVDRGLFCVHRHTAYVDAPQGIGYGVTISAPHMHAHCLELLHRQLQPGAHALDVGSGSGYLTAVMARMVAGAAGPDGKAGIAVGIEHVGELVARSKEAVADIPWAADMVHKGQLLLIQGDGRAGYEPAAPYDAIHVGAAAPEVPEALVSQLALGGRLVVPVGPEGGHQALVVVDKDMQGNITQQDAMGVIYVPLTSLDHQMGRT